ncbi:golgin subfamily A member 6-like protein 4 [Watersipora subatra]|uniref:golgin subfamily A member 6-like protein 4 n=1 Tax=Watersipora subatra TaxID=2589382 RepID=UPI00355BDF02
MTSRLELLEKLVNKCNLSTQRATHTNIITEGARVLDDVELERELRFQEELEEAVAAAEARAEREKQQALYRQQKQLNEEKERALQAQKEYLEQVAERVAEQRDRLEAERIKELTEKLENEKEEALRQQWEHALEERRLAVESACQALTIKLNKEHRLDKEMGIANALKQAREKFQQKMQKAIEETTEECERMAREEAERVRQLHMLEIHKHELRYDELKEKYLREHKHRNNVESDFLALQTDYQKFMDHTDGKFHSDYLMRLRRHGMKLSERRLSDVSEYEPKNISDIIVDDTLRF